MTDTTRQRCRTLEAVANFLARRGPRAENTWRNILDFTKGIGYDQGVMAHILDQIRQAIEESDKTRYRIAKETGISESRLSLLMSKKRGLSIDALEELADYLGLEVTLRPKKKRKGR